MAYSFEAASELTHEMSSDQAVEMDFDEIRTFLDRGGTGVLSLAAGDVPYSTPISYGFDPDERAFYFRLGFIENSEKRRFMESSEHARFVVYDRRRDTWHSVIARGTLEQVDSDALTIEVATNLRQAALPLFDIWDAPRESLSFEIYRLDAEEITGRKAAAETIE